MQAHRTEISFSPDLYQSAFFDTSSRRLLEEHNEHCWGCHFWHLSFIFIEIKGIEEHFF